MVENSCPLDQDVAVAGPSKPKSPRIENSFWKSLRASLKEEIISEIRNLLVESQKEMKKLLRSTLLKTTTCVVVVTPTTMELIRFEKEQLRNFSKNRKTKLVES